MIIKHTSDRSLIVKLRSMIDRGDVDEKFVRSTAVQYVLKYDLKMAVKETVEFAK